MLVLAVSVARPVAGTSASAPPVANMAAAGELLTPRPSPSHGVASGSPGDVPLPPAASPIPKPTPTATPRPTPPPIDTLTGYVWPIRHPRLTLPFGPTGWGSRVVKGERFHDGVDLATFCGDRIIAAHSGTVLAASRHYDRFMGWIGDLQPYLSRLDRKGLWVTLPILVVIDDGNGYRSMYAHFERVSVKPGQHVKAGQLIGYEGRTGHASGCHLHYGLFSPFERASFGIRKDVVKRMKLPTREVARVDPLLVLPARRGFAPTGQPRPVPFAPPAASPRPDQEPAEGQLTRR